MSSSFPSSHRTRVSFLSGGVELTVDSMIITVYAPPPHAVFSHLCLCCRPWLFFARFTLWRITSMGCPTHDPTHWSSQCVREMYPVFSSVTDQRCFCRDILFCAPRLNKTASSAATVLAATATTTMFNVGGNETRTAAAVFTSRFTSLPEGCTDPTNVARMRRSLSNDVLLQPASRRHVWSLVLHGCSSAGGVGTSGGGGETGGGESLAFNLTEAAHILEMKQLRWLHLDGGSTHASRPKWNVSVAIGRLTHLSSACGQLSPGIEGSVSHHSTQCCHLLSSMIVQRCGVSRASLELVQGFYRQRARGLSTYPR